MAQGGSGETLRGAIGLLDEYTALRKNDVDKAGLPILRLRGIVPFQRIMLYEKPNKKLVGDIKVVNFEQAEETNAVTIASVTSSTVITVANAVAQQIQPGDFLVNENSRYDINVATEYDRPASIQLNYSPEVAKVVSVGQPGGTNTSIEISRMHSWTGGDSTGIANWQTTDNVRRSGRSTHDGANSGIAVGVNPTNRTNYLQIFEKPFEVTELQQVVDKWSVTDPMSYNQMKALMRFHRMKEQTFLLDGYGAEGNTMGRVEPTTWSLARIAGLNATSPTAISEDTKGAFDSAVRPFLEKGTSATRWIFAGAPALLRFEQLFQSYMTESPLSGDKNLGIQVKTYMHPLGHTLNFVYSREMSDSARYKNSFLIANFEFIDHLVLSGNGQTFDTYLDKGKTGKGLGDSEKTTKYQWRSIDGLGFNDIDAAAGEVYFPF